jgi:uncharacterized protein CbrC (UPF0167 family)
MILIRILYVLSPVSLRTPFVNWEQIHFWLQHCILYGAFVLYGKSDWLYNDQMELLNNELKQKNRNFRII